MSSLREAVPSPPWKTVLFTRAMSPRQAIPRLPQEIALSHQQKVSSPRLAVSPLPRRSVLLWQRVLYFPKQSGAWQGLGQGRQVIPQGRTVWSLSLTALFPKGYLPRTMFPKKQGPSPIGTAPCMVLPSWRNLTQSG